MKGQTVLRMCAQLGHRDGLVLAAVVMRDDPSNQEIAKMTGFSVRTVQRAIKSLVSGGYIARGIKGPYRRLRPGHRLVSERKFRISEEEIEELASQYGRDRVEEAVHVLEYTYALSDTPPRNPLAILRAVLRRGTLRYPKGYVSQEKVKGYSDEEISEAKREFMALPRHERQVYLQKAYTLIYEKTRSHERALARARPGALALFMRERRERASPEAYRGKRVPANQ